MSKPKFYQAVLKEVKGNVLDHVYPQFKGDEQFSLEERMGNEEGKCPECDSNEWILLPEESAAVREGGKAYCECKSCGYTTHL